ncbi:MAG TPA: hypothetical protein VIU46_08835 [Gallionellaceae bacterium]
MMKKVALSLAGLLAAAAFAPEASALPVFARQTGMACSACHFQHFPILNGFGRSFKASGYTLMGAQGKVEGEDLSLPDRLNFGVLSTAGIEEQSGNVTATGTHNLVHVPGNGGELSLFFGGRVSDNVGFLSEFGASALPGMGSAKLPVLFDVGAGIRAGVVFLTTAGQGPAHSFELMNTGVSAVHMATPMPGLGGQHFAAASAAQYLGVGINTAGASVVVVNPDMFFVNVGKYATTAVNAVTGLPVVDVNALGGAPGNSMNTVYARGAFMFDAAGFNMGVGVMSFGGTTALNTEVTKAQVVDFQMMGDVGSGMTLLLTASYGKAPNSNVGQPVNIFNGGTKAKTALTVNASVGFTPKITGIIGVRQAKDGAVNAAGSALTDNAFQIGATYSLAQNIELSLTNTRQSGSAWNAVAGVVPAGQNATSLKMEALF